MQTKTKSRQRAPDRHPAHSCGREGRRDDLFGRHHLVGGDDHGGLSSRGRAVRSLMISLPDARTNILARTCRGKCVGSRQGGASYSIYVATTPRSPARQPSRARRSKRRRDRLIDLPKRCVGRDRVRFGVCGSFPAPRPTFRCPRWRGPVTSRRRSPAAWSHLPLPSPLSLPSIPPVLQTSPERDRMASSHLCGQCSVLVARSSIGGSVGP